MTMEILSGHPVRKGVFHMEFLKKGYYNAFIRVKAEMINQGLIEIYKSNNMRFIKLTPKGVAIKKTLKELRELMDNAHVS